MYFLNHSNQLGDINTDHRGGRMTTREYHEKLYANKLDNLDEKAKFVERQTTEANQENIKI